MDLTIRPTKLEDGASAYDVVRACPEMDLNSLYAYLMLCREFDQTSRIAFGDEQPLGYVCGYRPPHRPEAVFVWQIAVSPAAQGMGIGGLMLYDLATGLTKIKNPISHVEATVAAENKASRRLFGGLAKKLGAPFIEEAYITENNFGADKHPAEPLIRIGPIA